MNAQISVLVICVEAIIYLLLYNLHDGTFNFSRFFYSSRQSFAMVFNDTSLDHYNEIVCKNGCYLISIGMILSGT